VATVRFADGHARPQGNLAIGPRTLSSRCTLGSRHSKRLEVGHPF
jgi:hypothetical protein